MGKRRSLLPALKNESRAEGKGTQGESELLAVTAAVFVLALGALAWSVRHGAMVMYGDAEAHHTLRGGSLIRTARGLRSLEQSGCRCRIC